MMGSDDSINLGLENLWQTWVVFRKGKRAMPELDAFEYSLEQNLFGLHRELNTGAYRPGNYRVFTVCDNKKRSISVAGIRDRIVHRLIYDYLVPIYDKTFIYDAWSCRKGKGLLGAIERAQSFFKKNPRAHVWRSDIHRFFDSVDQTVLLNLIGRRVHDQKTFNLIHGVVDSFRQRRERVLLVACPSVT